MSVPGPANDFVVADTDAVSFVLKQDPVRGPRYARHFAGRNVVLPFSVVAELRLWAEVRIAATAIHLGVPLVTHNADHYRGVPHLRVETEPDV